MGIPAVSVKKSTVGGAPAIQTTQGILAIIASCVTGSGLPPTMITNQSLAVSTFGGGMLPECAVYDINVSGQPVVAVPVVSPSIPGSYYASTFVKNITGSASVSVGATAPLLHYNVQIVIVNGGTVGVSGITYTYTVDGGDTVSSAQSLGTSSTLTIPGTGVSFALGGGSLNAQDNWSIYTERPLLNNSDVSAQLAILGNTKLPWEGVLIDCQYGTGTVSLVDTWLAGREQNGQFNFAILNTRFLFEPTPTGESAGVYAAAMIAQTGSDASNRLCVCADGGHMTSLITGFTTKFPTSLALGAVAMSVTPNIGIDPAFVGLGPVPGFQISSNGGNPNDWDEFLYQSLDSQRLTTLRTFATDGPVGTFITDANVLISSGSNIYWLQLLRVLNKACSISWQILNTQLSRGVQTVFNATTGAINIKETAAQSIEGLVNGPLTSGLSGQCTAAQFTLNRDDNLVAPKAPVNAQVAVVPLVYLKNLVVTAALVKAIAAPNGGA